MSSPKVATAVWLGAVALVSGVLFAVLEHAAVHTIRGQLLDAVALTGNGLGRDQVAGPLDSALNAVSVVSVVVVLVTVGSIALVRRRYSLAIMAVVLVVGSSASTLLLKDRLIDRPFLGVDIARAGAGNSYPSGHATAAAAFAVGLVLVLPPAVRGVASLIGATYRPSDVVGAYLLVCGWSALAGLLLVLAQRRTAVVRHRDRAGWSLATTAGVGVALLAVGGLALGYTFTRLGPPVEALSPRLLSLGYLGSAATVGGAAYLMMAVVLLTIHRVVPHSKDGSGPTPVGMRAVGSGAAGP
jgi:hypothetical protein